AARSPSRAAVLRRRREASWPRGRARGGASGGGPAARRSGSARAPATRTPRTPPCGAARATATRARAAGRRGAAEADGRTSSPRRAEERRERTQPVALRREHAVRNAERAEHARDAASLFGCGRSEPVAQGPAARVDPHLATGLRIDEPELADVRQLLLAWVAHLDCDDVVPAHRLDERLAPVERAAEVRDDHHQAALARDRVRPRQGAAERRRADPLLLRLAAQRLEESEQAVAALLGRKRDG